MRKMIMIVATVLIVGCTTLTDSKVARIDNMSCSQLDVALDYEVEGRRDAEASSLANGILHSVTKGEVSNTALGDSIVDDIEAAEHGNAEDYIRQRQYELGC